MNTFLKKILVILPVLILSFFFLRARYHEEYAHVSFKRLTGFALSVLLIYILIMVIVARKKQDTVFSGLVQSSFFVYVFMVLTLTGYFILFKEVSSHGWWEKMMHRVQTKDNVNLRAFQMFRIYSTLDKQVVGNFIMLLPLGIYLPLLYKRLRRFSGFFAVLFLCLFVSIGIELLQLITSYRSADIDDVILNTLGGCLGFIIYQCIRAIVYRGPEERIIHNK
jgi:glycopeptide antibiotics resistance protein